MSWSAAQYVKFEDERTRPVSDLLARAPAACVRRAADIGCGPGNSTEVLIARYPDAAVVGIDSSRRHDRRRPQAAAGDRLRGRRHRWPGDGSGFDLILANAVIQWIPDHEALLPALIARLAPGGTLAIQTPDNLDEPSHVLMREVAADGPWAARLAEATSARAPRRSADWYFRQLRGQWRPGRHLAHDLFPPARRTGRDRRMGEGNGPSALPRSARAARARRLSRPLRGEDRGGLSGGSRRHGPPALSTALLRRDAPVN